MRRRLIFLFACILACAMSAHAQTAAVEAAVAPVPVPTSGPQPWSYGPFQYDPSGNITAIGTQSFVYDPMGRLVKASVSQAPGHQVQQTEEYTYDVYGNLTAAGQVESQTTYAVDAATNHLTTVTYDAAGNIAKWKPDGSAYERHYTYDALSRLVEEHVPGNSDVVYHVYTADDERYYTYTEHGTTPVEWHFTIRDLGGNVLRDFQKSNTTWSVFRDYVYRDGTLLASLTSSAAQHISVDHLGSPRIFTSDSAARIGAHTFVPYGTEWSDGTAQEGDVRKFTGHERDQSFVSTESFGLDYMHARYYSPAMGRFLSPDPSVEGIDPSNPQSWNRYVYVRNNPVNFLDPDGRATVPATPVTEVIGRYMYHFDPLHGGWHIDISELRGSKWVKLGRVGRGLEPLKHMGEGPKIPKAALKGLLKNRSSLSAKAQAALEDLLLDEGASVVGKIVGELALPIAILAEVAIADKANADNDREAIRETEAAAEQMFGKSVDRLNGDELRLLWTYMNNGGKQKVK